MCRFLAIFFFGFSFLFYIIDAIALVIKADRTTTLTKMCPKWVHQNRIAGLPKALLGWDTSPFGPEAHGEAVSSS
jgi:hypothetical protein